MDYEGDSYELELKKKKDFGQERQARGTLTGQE